MNRREAFSYVSLLLGGTLVGAEVFISGCKNSAGKTELFQAEDIGLLDEIGETILPTTPGAAGAKAAKIGNFMKAIVTDCYNESEQQTFTDGITALRAACEKTYQKDFNHLSKSEKEALLTTLYQEAKQYAETESYKKAKQDFDKQQEEYITAEAAQHNFGAGYLKQKFPPHYFIMMRELTLWGYFSSEPGMTQALRYVETPGRYDGAYPYKKGDKAWAM